MIDYGFELLSDKEIDVESIIDNNLFTPEYLYDDVMKSMNTIELASRKFRDIATIAGLVFTDYSGNKRKHGICRFLRNCFSECFEDVEKITCC